jgi:hypothetical protein
MKNLRSIRLRGATGKIRTAVFQEREHLVVPVIGLMEGVIWPVNAETPEFVPARALSVAPGSWNGRPVFLNHPMDGGTPCSGNTPSLIESQSFGMLFNSYVRDKKLSFEAWLDPVKAARVGENATRACERVREHQVVEVSVGALVTTMTKHGSYNGTDYDAEWVDIFPDHLAILDEDSTGACSVEMGCGTNRSATIHILTDHGLTRLEEKPAMTEEEQRQADARARRTSLKERLSAIIGPILRGERPITALALVDTPSDAAAEEAAELIQYRAMATLLGQARASLDSADSLVTDLIAAETADTGAEGAAEDAEEMIETAQLSTLQSMCMQIYGTLNSVMSITWDLMNSDLYADAVPVVVVNGKSIKVNKGARHSAKDMETIQGVHDHAVSLGATCATPSDAVAHKTSNSTHPCGCGGSASTADSTTSEVTTMNRADKIAALLAAQGYTQEDSAMLNACTDTRLDSLLAATRANAAAPTSTTPPAAAAPVAAAAAPVAAAAAPAAVTLTPEQIEANWLAGAPQSVRDLVARQKAAEAGRKSLLVSQLKTAQSVYTEADLNAMTLETLEKTASLLKVAPVTNDIDFGVRGAFRDNASNDDEMTVPAAPDLMGAVRAARGKDKGTAAQ